MKHEEMVATVIRGRMCERKNDIGGVIRVSFCNGELKEKLDTDATWGPLSSFVYNNWELVPHFVSPSEAFAAVIDGKHAKFDGWRDGTYLCCWLDGTFEVKFGSVNTVGSKFVPTPAELTKSRWVIL